MAQILSGLKVLTIVCDSFASYDAKNAYDFT